MNVRLATSIVLLLLCGPALAGEYILTIDGEAYDIGLQRKETLKLSDGRILNVLLVKKETLSHRDDHFSFDYPSRLTPQRRQVREGVSQTTMVSRSGTLVIVQAFTDFDPRPFVRQTLERLTQRDVQRGYKITMRKAGRTLSDGTRLTGETAVATHGDKESTLTVLCHSMGDAGLLFITRTYKGGPREEQQIVDLFWRTLTVSTD